MGDAAEHAVFVLPTREDVARFEAGEKPGNVLWREFDTAEELAAYASGIEAVEDEFDEIETLGRVGSEVKVGRADGEESYRFAGEALAEAFVQGMRDSEGFHAPLLIGRGDARFAGLAELRGDPAAGPRP